MGRLASGSAPPLERERAFASVSGSKRPAYPCSGRQPQLRALGSGAPPPPPRGPSPPLRVMALTMCSIVLLHDSGFAASQASTLRRCLWKRSKTSVCAMPRSSFASAARSASSAPASMAKA